MHEGTYHNFIPRFKGFRGLVSAETTETKANTGVHKKFPDCIFLCNNFICTLLHTVPFAVPLQLDEMCSVPTPLLGAFAELFCFEHGK
jgi:hypothetical protein